MKIPKYCLLLAALWLPACLAAPAVAQPMADSTSIRGQVVDEKGAPISGAAVAVRRPYESGGAGFWGAIVYTDAKGNFAVDEAEGGRYSISVEASGFATVAGPSQLVSAASGSFRFVMKALGTLPLRIVGADGKPLREGTIALSLTPIAPSNAPASGSSKTIGADGLVTITDIVPGTYRLDGLVPELGYIALDSLEIKSGVAAIHDAVMTTGGALHITAVADDGAGGKRPLGGMRVEITRTGAPTQGGRNVGWMLDVSPHGWPSRITRDGDGTATIPAFLPGKYQIMALNPSTGERSAQVAVDIGGGATTEVDLVCKAHPAAQIELTVVAADGTPAGNLDLAISAQQLGEATGDDRPRNQSDRNARTDAAGHCTLYPVPAGRWRLLVRASVKDTTAADAHNFRIVTPAVTTTVGQTEPLKIILKDQAADGPAGGWANGFNG